MNIGNKPLLSVVIPVYNQEKFLDECIHSIVSQDYNDLEIIIIDDGSTDRSSDICDGWKTKDSRIQVVHTSNHGLSAARNLGLQVAKGEYITFVDSDDCVEQGTFKTVLSRFNDNNIDIIQYPYRSFPTNETQIEFINEKYLDIESICKGIFRYKINMGVWNKVFKKDIIKNARFEQLFYEDTPFLISLFERGAHLQTITEGEYLYRRHGESITGSIQSLRKIECKSTSIFIKFSFIEKTLTQLTKKERIELHYFMIISAFRELHVCKPHLDQHHFENLISFHCKNKISLFEILTTRLKLKQTLILLYEKIFGLDRLISRITHLPS